MIVVKKTPKNRWRGERVDNIKKKDFNFKNKGSYNEPQRKIKINW